MSALIENIKESEGFVNHVYKDHLGKDTIGYGTLMPLTKDECELLLVHRLEKMKSSLINSKYIVGLLSERRQNILFEMCYQLGVSGLLNFKNMWKALEENDFKEASIQMMDSKWAKQTPERAYRLSQKMI